MFSEPALLARALTHRSLANQIAHQSGADSIPESTAALEHNERLEFLGDSVLNLVVAEALFTEHPEWNEGQLTRVRAQLVSRAHMAEVALAIDLGRYLRLSRGKEQSGLRRNPTVLSDTMEAVMGALFLDGGLNPVRSFTARRIMGAAVDHLAEELRTGAALGNYKSALQELLQARHSGTPIYRIKNESGPGHRKRFLVEVRLKTDPEGPGTPLARGVGTTKKDAEQDAARRALALLIAADEGADRTPEEGIVEEPTES